MTSKDKQTKLGDDEIFSKDKEERFIIEPKTTKEEETEFIKQTMKLSEENKAKKQQVKDNKKKKQKQTKEKKQEKKKEDTVKHINDVEKDIEKEIEFRKIIKPSFHRKTIKKTTDLFGKGFHYFIGLEEKFTQDFLFGYLPDKIKKYIKIIIPFFFMFLILALPVNIDYHVKRAFALFICISLLWALESLSMIVTALLIPVLAVMLGLIQNTNPFDSFSNPIIYLLLSGLIIAQAFRKHDLDRMLALKVLALSKGKVKKLLLFLMLISALLGMWMSNTATIALLIPVILSISSELKNSDSEKNYTSMLLLSAGFSSAIGGLTTILGGNPNAITAAFLNNVGRFEFLDWSIIGFPVSIVMFIIAYWSFSRIYNIKDEKIDISELKEEAKNMKLNHQQKKILMIFIPTILAWLFGAKLFAFLNLPSDFFRTEVVGLTASILFFVLNILRWDDVRGIPWEIFLLVGGGLTLGQILIDTGAASFIAVNMFSKLTFLPKPFIILLLVLISMLLANFVNNSSTTIILVPVLMQAFPFLNINIKLMAMAVAMATAISPLTPIAMPAFSLIYGTGKVRRREMIKTGLRVAVFAGPVMALMLAAINWLFF